MSIVTMKCSDCSLEAELDCTEKKLDFSVWWWCRDCVRTICSVCHLMKRHTEHRGAQWDRKELVKSCLQALEGRCSTRSTIAKEYEMNIKEFTASLECYLIDQLQKRLEDLNEPDRFLISKLNRALFELGDVRSSVLSRPIYHLPSPTRPAHQIWTLCTKNPSRLEELIEEVSGLINIPYSKLDADEDKPCDVRFSTAPPLQWNVKKCADFLIECDGSVSDDNAYYRRKSFQRRPERFNSFHANNEICLVKPSISRLSTTSLPSQVMPFTPIHYFQMNRTLVVSHKELLSNGDVPSGKLKSPLESDVFVHRSEETDSFVDPLSTETKKNLSISDSLQSGELQEISISDSLASVECGNSALMTMSDMDNSQEASRRRIGIKTAASTEASLFSTCCSPSSVQNISEEIVAANCKTDEGQGTSGNKSMTNPDDDYAVIVKARNRFSSQVRPATASTSNSVEEVVASCSPSTHSTPTNEIKENNAELSHPSTTDPRQEQVYFHFGQRYFTRPIDVLALSTDTLDKRRLAISDSCGGVYITTGRGDVVGHLPLKNSSASSLTFDPASSRLLVSVMQVKSRSIFCFDIEDHFKRVEVIPCPRDPKIEMSRTRWITMSPRGELFVVSGDNHRSAIWMYNKWRKGWKILKESRKTRYQYLCVAEDQAEYKAVVLLTCDAAQNRLLLFVVDQSGTLINEYDLTKTYRLNEYFENPASAVVDSHGNLLVLDYASGRLWVLLSGVKGVRRLKEIVFPRPLGQQQALGIAATNDWVYVTCFNRRQVVCMRYLIDGVFYSPYSQSSKSPQRRAISLPRLSKHSTVI